LRKASSIPPGLSDLVIETADGNPFYIEEMIKMLIDQKVIIPGPEVWEIQIDRLRAAPVPVTLAGVLQARLDCLSPPERAILQRASVIGRVFWDGALESMGPAQGPSFAGDPQGDGMLSKGEIDRTLTDLRAKELISPREASAFAGSTEYVFKHELLRNAAYESLLKRSRRGHHGQVADWLIQQSGERSAEFAGQVATHLAHAGRLAEAAEWYGRAGKQACAGYEPAMAIEYLHKALELLPREQTQTTGANRLEWLKSLGESLCAQARFDEAREMFVQMRCLAEESGHLVAQARAWNGLAFVQERRADNRASVAAAEKAEELARRAGESGYQELVRAMHYKGWALYRLADWKGVLRLARQSQALCVGLGDRHRLATSLKLLGVVYLQRGNFAKADECFRNGLGLYGEFDDRRNSAAMWSNLGESARLRGDFGAAVGFYEKALAISRQIGSRESEMIYLSNLSGARLGLHQFAQAEEALRELIPLAETRTSTMLSEAFSFLCAACLGQQKPAEALKAARRALALGRQSGNELDVGIAWRMLGRASARIKLAGLIPPTGESGEGAPLDPEACFVESVTRFKKLNLITEEARTLRAWAAFDLREGRTEEGLRKAAEAKRLLSRLGMSPELETSVRSPYETH